MIRVVIADDQSLVRMGLTTLLESENDLELVGEADNGRTAVELTRQRRPDVVLMDIRMPRLDGLEALRTICADPALHEVKVIMLTTFELDEYVFESLRGGASGFVLKDAGPDELLHAIRVVADGGSLLTPSVTRRVIAEFTQSASSAGQEHPDIHRLTAREREIVGWVARGLSNEEIAAQLVLSPATVRTHVSRSMVKLAARDRAQLVVFAIQSGISPGRLS